MTEMQRPMRTMFLVKTDFIAAKVVMDQTGNSILKKIKHSCLFYALARYRPLF